MRIIQDSDRRPPTRTDAGISVASEEHSPTVGTDGPILLQDLSLIELTSNLSLERIPVCSALDTGLSKTRLGSKQPTSPVTSD